MSVQTLIEAHEQTPSPRANAIVLVALMGLLALTIALAFVDFDHFLPGSEWSLLIAMSIAVAKGLLIAIYFMHLKYGARLVTAAALAGFVWLGILLILTGSDYLMR